MNLRSGCAVSVPLMAPNRKPQLKSLGLGRVIFAVSVAALFVLLSVSLFRTNVVSDYTVWSNEVDNHLLTISKPSILVGKVQDLNFLKQNAFSRSLEERNKLPPRNLELYPHLARDHIVIVLYVHNRPQYLKVVMESLSRVVGINETLLIVSHDGYFEEMNNIVEGIKFCQVKQIFAPYSPHVFPRSFPGTSPNDCKDKDDPAEKNCIGNPDQYGNHRSPKIVSLKHHWWWMMNTVWDGLEETSSQSGHILFIEEDHFIFPNAYRNLQLLTKLKPEKCPNCFAANLAPCDVKSRGERVESLIAERMGNVGYSFDRNVWRKIHLKAREFCYFDEYNWDITMWSTVFPSFGSPVYTIRGPRTSAVHFGKCGLHQGQGQKNECIDNGQFNVYVEEIDKVPNINPEWKVSTYSHQQGYQPGFKGWGGWGDERDRQLCLMFASMYAKTVVES